jgi:RNA polymerase-binding transcription factor DksA
MNEQEKNQFKVALEKELAVLEKELSDVGRRNPSNKVDWEATQGNVSAEERSEPNEVADKIEEYEEHAGVLKELEKRYNDVKLALTKIDGDMYGVCEVGGEMIEPERLEANPAARTCETHRETGFAQK